MLMRWRPCAVVVLALALGSGTVACGGSGQVGDVVPKSTPELLPPDNRSLAPAAGAGASSADADDTPSTGPTGAAGADSADTAPTSGAGAAAAGTAPATPTASTPPVATTTPAATPTTPANPAETGGADAGGFSTFCKDNPGACPE